MAGYLYCEFNAIVGHNELKAKYYYSLSLTSYYAGPQVCLNGYLSAQVAVQHRT
jgi:hypothetical protein